MKDFYIILCVLIIAISSVILAYKFGYSDGFAKGQTMCKVPIIEMQK